MKKGGSAIAEPPFVVRLMRDQYWNQHALREKLNARYRDRYLRADEIQTESAEGV